MNEVTQSVVFRVSRRLALQGRMDAVFRVAMAGCAVLVVVIIGGIFYELFKQSLPAIREFGLGFLVNDAWNPVTSEFGALSSIYGTLVSTLIALVIAVPLSVGVALFLVELAPPFLSQIIGRAIELLAAIPSIIYGMWGLFIFSPFLAEKVQPFLSENEILIDFFLFWLVVAVLSFATRRLVPWLLIRYTRISTEAWEKPLKVASYVVIIGTAVILAGLTWTSSERFSEHLVLFQGPPMGIGMLSSGIILALMILPYISSVMRDVFTMVPSVVKESAYGIGSTTWEVTSQVTIPYGMTGIIGACFLGLGRALGETMAVTFVIGNAHRVSPSLFDAGNTIASTLANEFGEAYGTPLYLSALMELGLVLCVITFIVQIFSQLWLKQAKKKMGRGL